MLEQFPKEAQHIIQLYQSGETANIDLAQELEQSLDINLHPFWETVSELYYTIPRPSPRNEAEKSDLIQLINKPSISFWGKPLKQLPKGLFYLDKLWFMRADEAQIEQLPRDIHKLYSLQRLSLVNNNIQYLPYSFCRLAKLEEVNLGHNLLQQLPERIGDLKQLKELRLHRNKLKTLPKSIGQLDNLSELTLGHNQIEYLPEAIKDLKNLRFINLENNLISSAHRKEIISWLPNTHIYWGKAETSIEQTNIKTSYT